jgi:hypothetical protein
MQCHLLLILSPYLLCWSAFCCDKTPKKTQLKRGKICFDSWFPRFQSRISCLHCFGPVARQNIKVPGVYVGEEAAHLMVERKGKRGGQGTPFKDTPPSDLLPPTSAHLLLFPPLPNSATSWGPSLQHMSLQGTFHVQMLVSNNIVTQKHCQEHPPIRPFVEPGRNFSRK